MLAALQQLGRDATAINEGAIGFLPATAGAALAMTATGVAGGAELAQLGVRRAATTAARVFWSGAGAEAAANAYATATGAITLGMTALGNAAMQAASGAAWGEARDAWIAASQRFAAGASGEAHVFLGAAGNGVDAASVWVKTELPMLMANSRITDLVIHIVK